ncbi:flagellar FlbD family protein [Enterococcus cecorum]|nr:flagellar FlbD family protein [Enterococcus cecorum]
MKLIKLTNSVTENTIYINEKHLVAFWVEDGQTVFVTSNEDGISRVKETPEEIMKLIEFAWKV